MYLPAPAIFIGKLKSITDYTLVNNLDETDQQTSITSVCMDFDFHSAFKVGLGINFNCDCWQLFAEYTWYHHCFDNGQEFPDTGDSQFTGHLNSPWVDDSLNVIDGASASAKWHLDFDKVDLELARPYYVGRCLKMRTAYGIRALWIDQKISGDLFSDGGSNTTCVSTFTSKTSSWAVGPKIGIDTKWDFCWGVRFFGNFDIALLYTKYDRSLTSTATRFISGTTSSSNVVNIKNDNPCFLRPQTNLEIGFGWGDYFCCNSYYFDLELGYEAHVYFNENMFLQNLSKEDTPLLNSNKQSTGSLYLHGLTVTARIDF